MSETVEIVIPDNIQEYLEPISGDSPVGVDASETEEFFKLNMEFPKTVPDYKNWIELSEVILKEKSKDIKVASWLCFAFYRTENLKGFRDGLILVNELLKKFGNDLFPANPALKNKAIQFLNTSRVTKLLEREEINKANADFVLQIGELVTQILGECEKLMPDNVPVLQSLQDIFITHTESAKKALNPPPVPEKKPTPPPQPRPQPKPSESFESQEVTPVVVKMAAPASEDDAVIQLRRTLTYLYEYKQDGETKERVPDSFFAFGIARLLQWSTLPMPVSDEKVTNIEPPNDIVRRLMSQWFNENKYDILIPRIELEFIRDNSEFRYWFDAQRYLVQSLEAKGGNYGLAAQDIKYHLARLIKRLPDLPDLIFSGGEVPFADKETKQWLEEVSRSVSSGGGSGGGSAISIPIVDAVYDDIKSEYMHALNELPAKFEENFEKMRQGLNSDERTKGKFLRRLNLANYCYEAKHYNVAKVYLEELKALIDELKLGEWEPALSVSAWQSLYLTNVQLLFTTDGETARAALEKQQEELYYKIARYNGILAINLEQQKHKRRK